VEVNNSFSELFSKLTVPTFHSNFVETPAEPLRHFCTSTRMQGSLIG
jgi:hypothetical protein